MFSNLAHGVRYRRYVGYLCVAIFFFALIDLLSKYEINDFVHFGPDGDTHEYQCLAVNLVSGHGYKVGWIEDFSRYKFTGSPGDISLYKETEAFDYYCNRFIKPQYSFYRTPGYPFFLALVYKIFGIYPKMVKIVQVVLFALVVALMPLLGGLYWKKAGVVSGAITSFLLLRYFCPEPNLMLPEPLTMFSLVVWAFGMTVWERRPTATRTFLMGLASGLILFLRGSNAFVVLFFFLYLLFKIRSASRKVKAGALFIIGCGIILLPWSVYASTHSGKFILLSDQLEDVLLVGNNEVTVMHGGFSNNWLSNSSCFYYKLKDTDYSAPYKTFLFLSENRRSIPQLFRNKIRNLFSLRKVFVSIAGMFLYYYIHIIKIFFRRASRRTELHYGCQLEKAPLFPLIYFLALFLNSMISISHFRYTVVFVFAFILPAAYMPFYVIKTLKPET